MDQVPPLPPSPALGTTILLSVSKWQVLQVLHRTGVRQCLFFFGGWLLSLSTPSSKVHPCCSVYQNFLLSGGWVVVLHCMYISHFIHLFICRWTLGSPSPFGCLETLCYKHGCTSISSGPCFQLSWACTQSETVKSNGNPIFKRWWRRPHPSPTLAWVCIPPTVCKSSAFPTSFLTLKPSDVLIVATLKGVS